MANIYHKKENVPNKPTSLHTVWRNQKDTISNEYGYGKCEHRKHKSSSSTCPVASKTIVEKTDTVNKGKNKHANTAPYDGSATSIFEMLQYKTLREFSPS